MGWCYFHPGQCSSGQYFGGYGGGYPGYPGGGGGGGNGNSGSPFSDGNGGFSQFGNFLGFNINKAEAIRLAHGVIACLAFVIFFPLGAISMRVIPGRLAIIVHALFQLFAYMLYIVAFGLGIWMASTIRFSRFSFVSNRSSESSIDRRLIISSITTTTQSSASSSLPSYSSNPSSESSTTSASRSTANGAEHPTSISGSDGP
jgi:hypothetical protein